ncbi:curli assembly protein CsgF [Flocculibacter collagenilyticus]|uniref:curli assembly protein CsgF n=1 Tax=Flocculibacter collagenilyticus TaxID=2744479 RepID=UPI0018F4813F|nr:curli assembly protein CsgF [Flocculibacter collagenilyticus]
MQKRLLVSVLFLLSLPSQSSELVYTPTNPSFGGNPINGSFLLSKAQSQNKHKAPQLEKTYADRFQESLERAYINKMVREITDEAFGENLPEDSIFGQDQTFVSGGYQITIITSDSDSITVELTNLESSETTIIVVPRFETNGSGIGAGGIDFP